MREKTTSLRVGLFVAFSLVENSTSASIVTILKELNAGEGIRTLVGTKPIGPEPLEPANIVGLVSP